MILIELMSHVQHPDKKLELFVNFLQHKQLAAAMKKYAFFQSTRSRLSDLVPHLVCFSCSDGVPSHIGLLLVTS